MHSYKKNFEENAHGLIQHSVLPGGQVSRRPNDALTVSSPYSAPAGKMAWPRSAPCQIDQGQFPLTSNKFQFTCQLAELFKQINDTLP